MATLKTLVRRFVDSLLGRSVTIAGVPDLDGTMTDADAGGITDGVNYAQPALLPRQLAEALTKTGKASAFLTEAARDTFRFQFDTPQRSADDMPFQPPTEDPLKEWNWSTREYVLTNTHAAYQRNPIANRGCKYMASFVVGPGFNLSARNPDVQALLDAFIQNPDNAIREYERQAVIDLLVDGELLLRFFSDDGETVVVPQRPWECHWIETERGFFRRPATYHFQRQITEGDSPFSGTNYEIEDVPAKDIHHVAINRHSYELRGRPELYVILPWLRAYKEWLENRARQNHWRNALLWLVKVASTAPGQIAQVAARWRKPPAPGSVAVESDKVSVEALSNPVGADGASEDGRQIKLMSAVGFGLPEYFLSDGSNANLASSSSQQLPALMTFADFQRIMIEQLWFPVLKRVLQEAVDAGDLPAQVQVHDADGDPMMDDVMDAQGNVSRSEPCLCDVLDSFDVSYAPIEDANKLTLAQALEIFARNGWIDDETATTESGYDYQIVQKRLERQRKQQRDAMTRGEIPTPPGVTPPGMDGALDDEPADGEEDEEVDNAVLPRTA